VGGKIKLLVGRANSIETCYWKFCEGRKYPFLLARNVKVL